MSLQKPKHAYVWENGELWCRPSLRFTKNQWEFVLIAMETVRTLAQQPNLSDSKCIEFMVADFAASYGIVADVPSDFVPVGSDDC